MDNVRSLDNELDELAALGRSRSEVGERSVTCFTEAWLHETSPDSSVTIDGRPPVRADGYSTESGTRQGGRNAIFINNRWCHSGHTVTKERICSLGIEGLLAVGLCPDDTSREFTHAIMVPVYLPPLGQCCDQG